jgi:putative flavoprotein involved in K+ transport
VSPDLKENLGMADMGQKMLLKNIDDYIQRAGVDAPIEDLPAMTDGYRAPEITTLDLRAEGINTIIWACGYNYDASFFQFPVLNQFGLPDAPRGVSNIHPGVYLSVFPF